MDVGPSPYFVTKNMMVIEEVVRGLRFDINNVFRGLKVVFKLPGIDLYNSARLWVYKTMEGGSLTVDIF